MLLQRWLVVLPLRWRSLFRRHQVDLDLDDEIQYHLEVEVERLVAAGCEPGEAAREARRAFDDLHRTKERCRDTRGVAWVDGLAQDLRYAARTLSRNPGFTAVAALTLALGVGANTAVFSLVDGILLARLPYPSPERLVGVRATYPNGGFAALRQQARSLEVAAYAAPHTATLRASGLATRVTGTRVSAELFTLLGVRPALGRLFRPGEDRAPAGRVAILSHQLWMAQFGGERTALGRSIELDGMAREVVGVMPADFRFPSARTDVWVPLSLDPGNTVRYWAGDFMPIIGRLRPGSDRHAAQAELRLFQSRVTGQFPWPMPDEWNRDLAVVPLGEAVVGDVQPRLLVMAVAVVLVLLIACANVANLSLSKAAAREREIAIRTALGAGPRRIARQLLTESVLLGAIGGVCGWLVSIQALALLKLVLPADTPRLSEVHLNARVLGFTAAIALIAGCLFGLAPVLHALRVRLRAALDAGGRSGGSALAGPLRAALTVGQIAGAVVLVIAAGLLVRSLWTLTRSDPGFQASGLMTARLAPADATCATAERCLGFYRQIEARVQAVPGITAAALINTLPLTGEVAKRSLELEGYRPDSAQSAPLFWLNATTPRYFEVMGIRLLSGRVFSEHDVSSRARVAVVTASTARRFWPTGSAVGKHVRFVGEPEWHTVVGVVADVRAFDLTSAVPDWIDGALYVPYGAAATLEDGRIPSVMTMVARGTGEDAMTASAIANALRSESASLVVSDVRPMPAVVAEMAAAPSATATLLVSMAALALVLGSVGVYGVLSFLVSKRTRDLGVRLALGAQRRDVFWLVLGQGARLCLAGIVLGVLGALALSRWLQSQLHGVTATDPATYVLVVSVVAAVTLTACYLPTRRAMSVDPLIVLRDE